MWQSQVENEHYSYFLTTFLTLYSYNFVNEDTKNSKLTNSNLSPKKSSSV